MNASELKRRWFYPTPGWLVLVSLATTGFMYLSERFQWFAFNHYKGWTVLIGVASVVAVLVVMLLWWVLALLFRLRFQFSIRSLLVLVVAVAVPCSWLAVEMKKARQQSEAVDGIRKLVGGSVSYDTEFEALIAIINRKPRSNPPPTEAAWLRNLLGIDFFHAVEVVTVQPHSGLGDVKDVDAGLENLKHFTGLQLLALDDPRITDAGLKNLKGLTALQNLQISGTRITDAGLETIQHLTGLQVLLLNNTGVTDAGLKNLNGLTALQHLDLSGSRITDAGLENLKDLPALQELYLNNTRVTDAGLETLRGLHLRDLEVSNTKVTTAALRRFERRDGVVPFNMDMLAPTPSR